MAMNKQRTGEALQLGENHVRSAKSKIRQTDNRQSRCKPCPAKSAPKYQVQAGAHPHSGAECPEQRYRGDTKSEAAVQDDERNKLDPWIEPDTVGNRPIADVTQR